MTVACGIVSGFHSTQSTLISLTMRNEKEGRMTFVIFTIVALILVFAKINAGGFNILWCYFVCANQTIAVFAFAMITVYMMWHKQPFIMSLIPGMFYMFVISSFILNAAIGFNLPWIASYTIAGILTAVYGVVIIRSGISGKKEFKK